MFAEEEFALHSPAVEGEQGSKFDHLKQAADTLGVDVESLINRKSEFPEELAHVWHTFLRLDQTRGGGFGPSPLSYVDVLAYTILTGTPLPVWEVDVIFQLDRLRLKVHHGSRRSGKTHTADSKSASRGRQQADG